MTRAAVACFVIIAIFGGAKAARAEEPTAASRPAPPTPPTATPCPPLPEPDVAADQRAFELEMELFARRWEFTQKLVAEREARALDEAEARYVRFAELTKKLAADAAAEAERQFEAAVDLFVRKRELTLTLSVAKPVVAPAPPAPVVR